MRHAGPDALQSLRALLEQVRVIDGLCERKPGVFYRKSQAFLHFHEDPAGLFADVRIEGPAFERLAVNTLAEQDALLALLKPLPTKP